MDNLWRLRAKFYDLCEASDLRRGPQKAALFRHMAGRILFVAIGTGIEIKHFPPGLDIVGVEINEEMLQKARARQHQYSGKLTLLKADVLNLSFLSDSFDTVVTSCTMCSVPDPLRALRELHRVLRPGGKLLLFEHVRSRNPILGWALDLMTFFTRRGGTLMNRDTLDSVIKSGFCITHIESVFLDIILSIRAVKVGESSTVN